ncbi:CC0125/CC1285 family lipoprotein [Henriciella litoralis]|uniref:CC0125/CC1285 family lipoprotein n=1 Tax=Henriciella litoralis TaxID=568102 RepID=UPI000A068C3E|nr:hypothetical protein [Henriciella litoralis]
MDKRLKLLVAGLALAGMTACATAKPYGPATSSTAQGYFVQPIETNRYRVTYTALSPDEARRYALRRAAEVTLQNGGDWFRVVNGYTDASDANNGPRSSVSIGGGSSSGRYGSGVGVGVGIGIPIGGSSEKTTESLEIIVGNGPKPADPNTYSAQSVLVNTAGPA